MDQPRRYFTVSQAEGLLPAVDKHMTAARDLKRIVERKIADWQAHAQAPHGGQDASPADEVVAKAQVNFLVSQINEQLAHVTGLGALPKDLEKGLVDFPTRMEGEDCYLCWKIGETSISYWHGLDEGFPGRKPLKHSIHK